ncbi:Leucine rich repeat-containing protein [Lachnospiraceae bacterium]|nr:Leucine rich repeat-containing protein [Lachnospiraceae bacterium]
MKTNGLKSLLLLLIICVTFFSNNNVVETHAESQGGSVIIYNYLTCRNRSDTVKHMIREIDDQDKGIIFTITVSVKLPSGTWNQDPITTISKTDGIADINNGKVNASYSGGKYKYYVKAYANQALELSGIPEGSKVTCNAPQNIYKDASQTVTSSVIALSAFNNANTNYKDISVSATKPSECYLYYDYKAGSIEIEQQKDAEGKDLPDNLAVNYVVTFTGSGSIKDYKDRQISTADKKYSAVFAYDSSAGKYVAQLHMSITGKESAKIDFIPADTEYTIEVEDNEYYLLTGIEGQNGKIEKEKDVNHLSIYSYHGSEENAVATIRYDGKKIVTTPTPTATMQPTATATPTITLAPTATKTPAVNPTATNAPSSIATPTKVPAVNPTATNAPSSTATPTKVPAVNPTATNAPSSTATPTKVPAVNPTATNAPVATNTPAVNPTATNVPEATPTATNVSTATPEGIETPYVKPTATKTPDVIPVDPIVTKEPSATPYVTENPSVTPNPTSDVSEQSSGYLKKNTVIKSKKGIFVVIGKGKVAFNKPVNKKVKSVSIPKSIKCKGKEYIVTEISANAFKGCKKLKTVTISKNINKIGKKAFYGCKKLKTVKIKTTKLKKGSIGKKAFSNIYKKPVFKCPKKKLKVYKKLIKKSGAAKSSKYK